MSFDTISIRRNVISSVSTVLTTLAVASLSITSDATAQCNIGLKLFSSESGNAICALLPTHFNCIESCEWNTSCALTSHYAAFRGRRTYVSGMVLTSTTFIIQCCASLGTIVEMNTQREPKCVWVPTIETVEERGSMRFDPPLAPNEYVRDIVAKRLEKGRVNLRVQICKFTVQQSDCDQEKLSQEDANFHKLLLLRLNRTKEQLTHDESDKPLNTSVLKSTNTSFRDEKPMSRPISHTLRQPPQVPLRLQPLTMMPGNNRTDTTVDGGTDPSNSVSIAFGSENTKNDEAIPNGVLQFFSDAVSFSHNDQQPIRPHRDQPIAPGVFGTKNRNNDASISPRYRALHLPDSLRRIDVDSKAHGDSSNLEFARVSLSSLLNDDSIISPTSTSYNLQRFVGPVDRQLSFYSDYGPRGVAASNTWHQQHWPLPLGGNTSSNQELIPNSYRRRILSRQPGNEVNRSPTGPFGLKRTLIRPMLSRNNKFLLQTPEHKTLDNDEFVLKNTVQEDKINRRQTFHIQAPHHISSDNAAEGRTVIPPTPVQRFYSNNSNLIIRRPFTSIRQRQFRIQRLRHDKHQQQQQSIKQSQLQNRLGDKPEVAYNYQPIPYEDKEQKIYAERQLKTSLAAERREKSSAAALSGLLACCQQQAPGCKHLCSKDVSKEEIKYALVTQQCPPLSMASVIQCFPRHYNVTLVTQCCSQNAQQQSHRHAGTFTLASPNRLPEQCLGLCAPVFKLSFSHFACIDHISTIVDCYRDLLQ